MNVYIVIEGEKATKKLYKAWIPLVNEELTPINYLHELVENNFYVFANLGQPGYWDRIGRAIDDVNNYEGFDRLVISIDSEEMEFNEKLEEAKSFVERSHCRVEVRYVIQHFCLESWLLGNVQVFRRRPQDEELKNYIEVFDVRVNDPELLPGYTPKSWNRAQFSYRYLRAGIRDIYSGREFYNKHDSGIARRDHYFYQVKKRYVETQQIASFGGFLEAFV